MYHRQERRRNPLQVPRYNAYILLLLYIIITGYLPNTRSGGTSARFDGENTDKPGFRVWHNPNAHAPQSLPPMASPPPFIATPLHFVCSKSSKTFSRQTHAVKLVCTTFHTRRSSSYKHADRPNITDVRTNINTYFFFFLLFRDQSLSN